MQYYNADTIIYLNNRFVKAGEATTDLYGQSLHYGYGVFEGIRAYQTHNGVKIFKAREHYERLKRSADLIGMPFKWSVADLIAKTYQLIELNGYKDCYIRPIVYGNAGMTLVQPEDSNLMICAWKWAAYLGEKTVRVGISSFQRPNPRSTFIEAKVTGHYINSILATSEAKRNGYDEALLLDMNGNVAEGSGANIFIEKNGKLVTPALGNILPGITRQTVIELCRNLDIELEERPVSVNELLNADSAFFCGTAVEIIGIASVNETVFPLRWSETLGASLQRAYKNLVLEKENYEVII